MTKAQSRPAALAIFVAILASAPNARTQTSASACTSKFDAALREAREIVMRPETAPLKFHDSKILLDALARHSCKSRYREFVQSSPFVSASALRKGYALHAAAALREAKALAEIGARSAETLAGTRFDAAVDEARNHARAAGLGFETLLKDAGLSEADLPALRAKAHANDLPALYTKLETLQSSLLKNDTSIAHADFRQQRAAFQLMRDVLRARLAAGSEAPQFVETAEWQKRVERWNQEELARTHAQLECRFAKDSGSAPTARENEKACVSARLSTIAQALNQLLRSTDSHSRGAQIDRQPASKR